MSDACEWFRRRVNKTPDARIKERARKMIAVHFGFVDAVPNSLAVFALKCFDHIADRYSLESRDPYVHKVYVQAARTRRLA